MQKVITQLATAYNTYNAKLFESIIANDFEYESQQVFDVMRGKSIFIKYITGKFKTIKRTGATVYAEIGYSDWNNDVSKSITQLQKTGKACLIMAQGEKENKVAILMPKFNNAGLIQQMIMCSIAPHWSNAKRTLVYPGL